MLSNFNRSLELLHRLETNHIRVLFYDFPVQFSDEYKTYEYSRICTITKGEKFVSINQEGKQKYDTDGLLLLPPNSKINMTIKQPTKAVVFELSNEMIKQVSDKVSYEYEIDQNLLSQNNFYIGSKNDALNETLCRITRKFLQKEKHSEYLIDLYAQELVYHLIQNKGIHQVLNTECNNPINRAIKYMKDNYTQPISMQQLAYDLNMSQANFSQYFKKITRITPNQYLTKIKLEKAQELLKETSVTEVAFELGYANISHFILLFKRMYGVTPKQYQMMHHFHCRADKSMSLVE